MIGKTLAHYEITDLLGKGGMGEVYRARDTKLDRDVALKVLPREMSSDPERILRFQREARTLASLQHPNVASIYGFEDQPEGRFLVMELVEGEDLSSRLPQGRMPIDEIVSIGTQICEGLAAAHERGIVHRDLKPANIKLMADGTVKILDFGLARAYVGDDPETSDPAESPTITAAMTAAGVILGTAAYMSPEQARGKSVTQVADIWALGVILCEMLRGERLFQGETVSDTLAAVLKSPLDLDALPSDTPPHLRAIVRRCLQRDPRERFQHAGDVRWALSDSTFGIAAKISESRSGPGPWIAATIVFAALAAASLLRGRAEESTPARPLVKSVHMIPQDPDALNTSVNPAFSPDGTRLAFQSSRGIAIRDLGDLEARVVPGTEGASMPFWSPDGEWIGYVQSNSLMKARAAGGSAVPIVASLSASVETTTLEGNPSWRADGSIQFSTGADGLFRVPDRGGDVEIALPLEEGESDYHESIGLPGGQYFFVVHRMNAGYGFVDFVDADGRRRTVVEIPNGTVRGISWSPTGHLIYGASHPTSGLWALPFSLEDGAATGLPFLVAVGGSEPTVSSDGTLVYVVKPGFDTHELVWLDRSGQRTSVIASVVTGRPFPELSWDDRRVVMSIDGNEGRPLALWDATRASIAQVLTSDGRFYDFGRWTFDDREIAAYSNSPFEALTVAPRDGSVSTLVPGRALMPSWTRDGKYLIFTKMADEGFSGNLHFRSADSPDTASIELLDRSGFQWFADPSPDGRFLAYASRERGDPQIYVTSFPEPGAMWRISESPGSIPRWSRDGTELFWTERNAIMASTVDYREGNIEFGPPRKLFDRRPVNWAEDYFDGYDVSSDGQRFVVVEPTETDSSEPLRLVIVQNWASEFEN